MSPTGPSSSKHSGRNDSDAVDASSSVSILSATSIISPIFSVNIREHLLLGIVPLAARVVRDAAFPGFPSPSIIPPVHAIPSSHPEISGKLGLSDRNGTRIGVRDDVAEAYPLLALSLLVHEIIHVNRIHVGAAPSHSTASDLRGPLLPILSIEGADAAEERIVHGMTAQALRLAARAIIASPPLGLPVTYCEDELPKLIARSTFGAHLYGVIENAVRAQAFFERLNLDLLSLPLPTPAAEAVHILTALSAEVTDLRNVTKSLPTSVSADKMLQSTERLCELFGRFIELPEIRALPDHQKNQWRSAIETVVRLMSIECTQMHLAEAAAKNLAAPKN